jgi:hypothetical protein
MDEGESSRICTLVNQPWTRTHLAQRRTPSWLLIVLDSLATSLTFSDGHGSLYEQTKSRINLRYLSLFIVYSPVIIE